VDTIGECPQDLPSCLSPNQGASTGSYTFAKTLEYKAKHGLQSGTGKEVTVLPPTEYQERFVKALEGYFVACPGKALSLLASCFNCI